MPHSSVACPHCSTEFDLAGPSVQQSAACPNCQRRILIDPDYVRIVEENELEGKSASRSRPSFEHLLPPRFLVDDPDFVDHRIQKGSRQCVLLPDGKGGVRSIDENIIRIEHRGRIIELVALPPAEKRKRQRMINFVFVAIGILFLAILFAVI